MEDKLLALAREYDMLPRGGTVLCALSGGADSVTLFHRLYTLQEPLGFTLAAAHYNHCLRGEESDRDEVFVRDLCARYGVPLTVGSGDVAGYAKARGLTLEEAARELRYDFLTAAAQGAGASRIATAHNAGDNAETILLHLIRGAGLQGLTGIPPRRGALVRPLLTTTREEIIAYLSRHGLDHVEDSTNADNAYSRNKLRNQVIPLLQELNPQAVEHMGAAAARLKADNDCLTAQAANALLEAQPTQGGWQVPVSAFRRPRPIALRMVRVLFARLGEHDFRAAHLLSVLELCGNQSPSARVDLPHGLTARREYGLLVVEKKRPADPPEPVPLELGQVVEYGPWLIGLRPVTVPEGGKGVYLNLPGPAVVRPRRTGDTLALPGRKNRTLKKLFIDAKLPRERRESWPVVAFEDRVLYVPGFGPQREFVASPGTEAAEIMVKRRERNDV